jgi:eukaryotic-like serine/threonine-protein kinase
MASRQFGAGTVIDGFELHELLHGGGMAALWRVTHPDFDRPLIIKMPFIGWAKIRAPSSGSKWSR